MSIVYCRLISGGINLLAIIILSGIIGIILMTKKSLDFLHIIQLEGYVSKGYLNWMQGNKDKIFNIKGEKKQQKKPFVFTRSARACSASSSESLA